jgi:hypothetical protein
MAFEGIIAGRTARCLAPGQQVCTTRGPVSIEQLATAGAFEAVCYDPATQRYLARPARAQAAGRKPTVRVHTDQGRFDLTSDQQVMLEAGGFEMAAELTPGTRLCACTVKPEPGNLVTSKDLEKIVVDLAHLAAAECAIANWYPVPSVETLGLADVYKVEIEGAAAVGDSEREPNFVAWTSGPGGGIGIVVIA